VLALPGGYWSAELDGGDPSAGDEALIQTAMYGEHIFGNSRVTVLTT